MIRVGALWWDMAAVSPPLCLKRRCGWVIKKNQKEKTNCIFVLRNYDLKQTYPSVAWQGVTCKASQSLWLAVLKSESLISACFWLVCQLLSRDLIWYIFLPWKDMSVKMTDRPQALCGKARIPSSSFCNRPLEKRKSNPAIHIWCTVHCQKARGDFWKGFTSSLCFQSFT